MASSPLGGDSYHQGGLFGDLEPPKAPKARSSSTPTERGPRGDKSAPASPARRRSQAKGPTEKTSAWVACAQVALPRPLRVEFSYGILEPMLPKVQRGMRVVVPFGRRSEIGVVVGVCGLDELPEGVSVNRLRGIGKVLDPAPLLDEGLMQLCRWMAERWACSWGEALRAVLPGALKREQGRRQVVVIEPVPGIGPTELSTLVERFPKQHRLLRTVLELDGPAELRELTRRLNLGSDSSARTLAKKGWVRVRSVDSSADELEASKSHRERPEVLGDEQAAAVKVLTAALEAGESRPFLLEGVTGSGKTEVYLRAIEAALALGRGAIVLVPEIALTPQTVGWFRSRFQDGVAVLHSRMTDAQRLDMWTRVRRGEARVVVGARSAIFAPVPDLGVVVVDEEHEPSFKQSTTPRYHARDVALERARLAGAICILGSATPALESWTAARDPEAEVRLEHLVLHRRVSGRPMPRVEVIDMRKERSEAQGGDLFSLALRDGMERALVAGQQVILFQNRRGFAPVLYCPGCKLTVRCPHCDVAMTFHRRIGRIVCHSCCHEDAPPRSCPTCTRPGLRYLGAGSERIEGALAELLPEARVRRMDSDTMRRREDYTETLEAFGAGEVDILVGTQMIAKGLDFPNVTLVGIVDADAALHLPDFRAAERTFQLIAQVSGRAGRGEHEGRIIVQTRNPEHPAIRCAAQHDYRGFADAECTLRSELAYPPSGRLIRVLFEDEDETRTQAAAITLADAVRTELLAKGVMLLGPAPAPIALVRGRHRKHILFKARDGEGLAAARELLIEHCDAGVRPRCTIDVDPVSLF